MKKQFAIILFIFIDLCFGSSVHAEALDTVSYPDRVFGFKNINENEMVAPPYSVEDTKKVPCMDQKNSSCRCLSSITSVSLEQGLQEDKIEKIEAIIRNYEQKTLIPYARTLCKSSLEKDEDTHTRNIIIEGYILYYSPEFISIIYSSYPDAIAGTLNIDVKSEKILTFNDVVDANEQNKLSQYLQHKQCPIVFKSDQPFTLFSDDPTDDPNTAQALTAYFDKDAINKVTAELKLQYQNDSSFSWNACASGSPEEIAFMKKHMIIPKQAVFPDLTNSLAIAVEHITNPLVKAIYQGEANNGSVSLLLEKAK